MAEKQSDQTEKPTPKKVRDARKEGQVSKSQDLSKTLMLAFWLLAFWLFSHNVFLKINQVLSASFRAIHDPSPNKLISIFFMSIEAMLLAVLPIVFLASAIGIFIEFMQVGPIFSAKKLSPQLVNLNPVEGMKKMFSEQNLVELFKGILKILLVFWIVYLVIKFHFSEYIQLIYGPPLVILDAYWSTILLIVGSIILIFSLLSLLDVFYQKYAYMKNLMMSKRDIKQEHKESEGNPMVKGERKQLHQEWSQQNQLSSVRKASVIVINPTHIAVAILYEPGETDLPLVVAKGEGDFAIRIREVAEEAGVPIMQNVALARGLYNEIDSNQFISTEYFDAVAELLRWSEQARTQNK